MKITPKVPVLVLANGTRYLLIKNGVHTIGSDPACSIVLSDAGLDPLHMTLVVMNGSVLIQPHAAQILLNDDFLAQQQYLRDGDTVVTEGLVFTLAYEAAPAAPAADDDPFALPSSDFEEISPYIASEKTRFSGQGNYLDPDTRDDDDDMPPPPRYVSQPISPAASSDDDFALDDADLIQPTGDVDDDDDMPAPVTRGGVRLHDDDGDDDEQYGTQAPSRGATPIQPSPLVPSASAPQRSARDAAPDDVFFTAYYPRDAFVGRDMRFLVYAHIDALRDQIAGDAEQFVSQLGGSMPRPRSAKGSTSIHEGTPITVQIVSDTLDFEPISDTTQRWNGQSVRFDFSFQAPDALVNDTVTADGAARPVRQTDQCAGGGETGAHGAAAGSTAQTDFRELFGQGQSRRRSVSLRAVGAQQRRVHGLLLAAKRRQLAGGISGCHRHGGYFPVVLVETCGRIAACA
jgi:hypothetical protein